MLEIAASTRLLYPTPRLPDASFTRRLVYPSHARRFQVGNEVAIGRAFVVGLPFAWPTRSSITAKYPTAANVHDSPYGSDS
jgi:hypothetical protein